MLVLVSVNLWVHWCCDGEFGWLVERVIVGLVLEKYSKMNYMREIQKEELKSCLALIHCIPYM